MASFETYRRPKDPAQSLPYAVTFADELKSEEGGSAMVLTDPTIVAYLPKKASETTWTIHPSVTVSNVVLSADGQQVKGMVSGGVAGQTVVLTFGAKRPDGGNVVCSKILKIGDR